MPEFRSVCQKVTNTLLSKWQIKKISFLIPKIDKPQYICLWNELEQIIKKCIPEERAENTTLWYAGRNGMLYWCMSIHHHFEIPATQVVLQQQEQMTADAQAVQLDDEIVMPHLIKCSSYVKSNDEGILSLV